MTEKATAENVNMDILGDVAFKMRDNLMQQLIKEISIYEDEIRKNLDNDNFFSYLEGIVNGVVFFSAASAVHMHTSFLKGASESGMFDMQMDEEFINGFLAHVKRIFYAYLATYREAKKH